jgi:hypothetical protein
MKLLVMQFPPIHRHFIPPRSRYSGQHVRPLMFRDQVSHPYRTTRVEEKILAPTATRTALSRLFDDDIKHFVC